MFIMSLDILGTIYYNGQCQEGTTPAKVDGQNQEHLVKAEQDKGD